MARLALALACLPNCNTIEIGIHGGSGGIDSSPRLVRPRECRYPIIGQENFPLLTESEVQRSFRNLFKTKDVPSDTFDKAEALLDELRPESPLRHRLSIELEEIRKLQTARA